MDGGQGEMQLWRCVTCVSCKDKAAPIPLIVNKGSTNKVSPPDLAVEMPCRPRPRSMWDSCIFQRSTTRTFHRGRPRKSEGGRKWPRFHRSVSISITSICISVVSEKVAPARRPIACTSPRVAHLLVRVSLSHVALPRIPAMAGGSLVSLFRARQRRVVVVVIPERAVALLLMGGRLFVRCRCWLNFVTLTSKATAKWKHERHKTEPAVHSQRKTSESSCACQPREGKWCEPSVTAVP